MLYYAQQGQLSDTNYITHHFFSEEMVCYFYLQLNIMKVSRIVNILLGVLVLILLYKAECGKPVVPGKTVVVGGKKYEVVKQVIDTQYVKVKETKYKKGEDIYHDTTIYVPVPVLDSAQMEEVLSKYYAKNTFKDTMKLGEFGRIYIQDTVQYNKLAGRSLSSDLKFPTITNTTIVKEKPKAQLYMGAIMDYLQESGVQNPSVGLMLKTKRDRLYGISAGVSPNGQPVYGASFYIKL